MPFGEVFLEEKNAKWNTPYLFTSKELDKETGMYYFGARYQDPKLGIFISVDPLAEHSPNSSPYHYCSNNPINRTDPTGMCDDPNCPHSKLTGSHNLLVYINESGTKTNYDQMRKSSGKFDFVAVDNVDQVPALLQNHYGKNIPIVNTLVVRSHGHTDTNPSIHGPDLDNKSGQGIVHNPDSSKGLAFLKGLLSNNASIAFTACNSVMGYTDNSNDLQESSKSLAKNYSEYFLKGSGRNLFFNWAKSTSRSNVSGGQIFNFDEGMHQDSYGGFMQFYYNSAGEWSKNNSFYDITVNSNGGLIRSTIRPLSKIGGGDNPKGAKKEFLNIQHEIYINFYAIIFNFFMS